MVPLRKATGLRAYISIVMTIAVPVGAPLGGALTQWIGWRWAFVLQIPIGLLCLAMASWRLRRIKKRSDSQKQGEVYPRPDFNLLGIFLLGLSVASIMTICQFSGELKSKLTIGLPIASSIFFVTVLLFGINERYWTNAPLVPIKLLKTNNIGEMYLAQILLLFSYGGVEFWIRTKNYNNSLAAACILPVVFGNVLSAAIGSRIVQKTGRYKTILITGCVVAIASNALIAGRWPHRPLYCDMIFYAGMGLGVGSIFVCTFTALSVSVPSQMTATAMTNYYLCQQLGLVVGVSVVSSASRAVFEKGLSQDIPLSKDKSQLVGHVLNDFRFAFTLSESIQSIVRHCFLQSFGVMAAISCGGLVLVLLIFLKVPEKRLAK
ncbi:hypothetical protein HAV15_004710 [Penicillium sp. str. |nr:hypothetical protein HAV15_004710 [Penicillium sp. str. \